MAVVEISHPHLEELVGRELSVEKLEEEGSMLGVLFEDSEDDKLEVEVEPNRPDLLSVEGIARALRGFFDIETGKVDFPVEDGNLKVERDGPVKNMRRHIACARVKDLDLDEDELNSIIQLQEKLTETYGRKRKKIAIGLHDSEPLEGPIEYFAAEPEEESFVPLGREEEMTLQEILEEHEKGEKYGWILEGEDRYPVLKDANGEILSFPPIINGVVTEVDEDTEDLFIDVTGMSREEVETALNIILAALHERGGTIESVDVHGERMPDLSGDLMEVDADYVRKVSGLDDLSGRGVEKHLERMRYDAVVEDGKLEVTVPAYRADVMHPYDVIEDVLIGYGYDDVEPEIPDISTVGGKSDRRIAVDKIRDYLAGSGAQEAMTFILSNREKLFDRMGREEEPVVSMANPLTEDYTAVRNWILPSLVEVLGENQHNRYPQKLFEVGRCSVLSKESLTGAEDVWKAGYVEAGGGTGFSKVRGVLQSLAKMLDMEIEVEEEEHGSFRGGRSGKVILDGEEAGIIGEFDDEVLESWGVEEDAAGFELDVEIIREEAF
ncbi:MAG: phenylalanine--tRNA ligase subunit beta [Candidatus Nanohaloarchaea archaeon]|nr:phenylalanine--tRNA ligase subunit beta [Candidatus Nanohaloarchaea archaeon]